jgi:hypothetical protein
VAYFGESRGRALLIVFLGALILLSSVSYIYLLERSPLVSFYMMPLRFWELGVGCLLALLAANQNETIVKFNAYSICILVGLIVGALFTPLRFHGITVFVVVGLTALLIYIIRHSEFPSKILSHPLALKIGLISYSLYLWHWGVIVLARWTIGDSWWSIMLQIISMFTFAVVSYRCVEVPLRYKKWHLDNRIILVYGLTASCIVASSIYFLTNKEPSAIYLGSSGKDDSVLKESIIFKPRENYSELLSKVRKGRITCNMTPHFLSKNNPPPDVDKGFLSNCLASENRKVILSGDSFANAISNHVALAASEQGYEFRLLFGYGCPYPMNIDNLKYANRHECYVDSDLIFASLEENLNRGDFLVHRLYYQKAQYIMPNNHEIEQTFVSYDEEVDRLLRLVRRKNASLVIVGTNWEINECEQVEWFNRLQCPWDIRMSEKTRNVMAVGINRRLKEKQMEENSADFLVIDPIAKLCTADPVVCPVERANLRYMRDKQHLSQAAVDELYSSIVYAFAPIDSR